MSVVQVRPWKITPDEETAFRKGDATEEWLCRPPADVLKQFAGKWVAARDCKIIASADSFDALREQMRDDNLEGVVIHRFEKPGWVIYR
jgi:hypothetical protein